MMENIMVADTGGLVMKDQYLKVMKNLLGAP
jgi:hypothetical protein